MLFTTKQGADGAEQAQAIGCEYAIGAEWRLGHIRHFWSTVTNYDLTNGYMTR